MSTPESPIAEYEVLDLLTALVDKSLVTYDESTGRYRLLDTVRQYGRDRLMESGCGEDWRNRHRDHFSEVAKEAEGHLTGPGQRAWLDRLEAEHDNLRAALQWCDTESALGMAGTLWRFWDIRGYFSEGQELLATNLAEIDAGDYPKARAAALMGQGVLARLQGSFAAAQTLQEQCLEQFTHLADKQGMADSLYELGMIAAGQGDQATANTLFGESLSTQRALGNRKGAAYSLCGLGDVALARGDYMAARSLYDESLSLQREAGNTRGVAWSLLGMGNVALSLGDYAMARAFFEERLNIEYGLGNPQGIAFSLSSLGSVAQNRGDYGAARKLYEESLALLRESRDRQGIAWLLSNLGDVARFQAELDTARRLYRESLTIRWEIGDRLGIAEILEALAAAGTEGASLRGVTLLGAAEAIRERLAAPMEADKTEVYGRLVSKMRDSVSDGAFAAAWSEGRGMTIEQAVDYTLMVADKPA